jgi:steroid 5-alpha reductase family enzyme
MSPFPLENLRDFGILAITICAGMMLLVWLLHFPFKNAALVDVAWPLGILASTAIYVWSGPAILSKRMLLGSMVALWALRLSGYLFFTRFVGHPEEGRYQQLRLEWGKDAWWRFLVFFQLQALSCVVLSLPMFLASHSTGESLSVVEQAAALLFLLAMSGELIADLQLSRFKSNAAHKGQVCREGLWAWSRHPNYFFEWLIWVSFALFALPSPWGFLGLISPALIYHFVNNVTGIPPTEAQALRSRGEAYARYQREVSAFFPLPPRHE